MSHSPISPVEESTITRAILKKALEDWIDLAEVDVVVVGAGPAGLTAAKYLAGEGFRTVIFERRLSFGGGIGGGGMLFHRIVIESPAHEILQEVRCRAEPLGADVYVVDASELIAKLASAALDAGSRMILGVVVDDVIYRENPLRVAGVVVQWTAVTMAGLHVDPLMVKADAVADCTGHDAEVMAIAARKLPELGLVVAGEKSMWSAKAEESMLEKTGKVCPGLYAAGMSVAAVHQTPRMGPIFGGMLLSGKRVAEAIASDLRQK